MTVTPRTRFVFVGERPSARAVEIGATWQNGKLAARTLHDVLWSLAVDPTQQHYLNLWRGAVADHAQDTSSEQAMASVLRWYAHDGLTIIGMGQKVCRVLRREGVPHRAMVHPAARGAIRLRARYTAHVAQVLGCATGEAVQSHGE